MNRYIKPNANPNISLHDARVSKIEMVPASPGKQDGRIVLHFENGFKDLENNNVSMTGKASVTLSGIDDDFTYISYYRDQNRREVDFDEFLNDLDTATIDIMDEAYGYNLSIFHCIMTGESTWWLLELKVYHHHETVYEWEEKAPR